MLCFTPASTDIHFLKELESSWKARDNDGKWAWICSSPWWIHLPRPLGGRRLLWGLKIQFWSCLRSLISNINLRNSEDVPDMDQKQKDVWVTGWACHQNSAGWKTLEAEKCCWQRICEVSCWGSSMDSQGKPNFCRRAPPCARETLGKG